MPGNDGRMIADAVTGKIDVREATASLPEADTVFPTP